MKNITIISQPEPNVMAFINSSFFTSDLEGKEFAYILCEGNHPENHLYTPIWQKKVHDLGGSFHFIDNSKHNTELSKQQRIVSNADYVMIPGGNTFRLLNNLRQSHLFESLKDFFAQDSFAYLGMSASTIIVAPNIDSANDHGFACGFDENDVGLKDLTALNVIKFIPIVHYDPLLDEEAVSKFKETCKYEIKTIANDEWLVVEEADMV